MKISYIYCVSKIERAMQHWNIRVYGTVQGVYYRQSTQNKAQQLGLTGFARNEPDGSVYIEVEGEAEILQIFADWCKEGPQLASVERTEIEQGDWRGFDNFTIQRT